MAVHYIANERTLPRCGARFRNRQAVLAAYQRTDGVPQLFVPSFTAAALGEEIEVKVTLQDSGKNFYIKGVVRQVCERDGELTGYTLLFRTREQERSVLHLIAFCTLHRRAAPRYWLSAPVTCVAGEERSIAVVRDLSSTGAFVQTSPGARLPAGARVQLHFRHGALGLKTTVLELEIVWNGVKHGKAGFGGRFLCPPERAEALMHCLGVGR